MSADLTLIAAPDNDQWRDRWRFLNGAEFIGAEDDDPRDEDGYALMGSKETGFIRGLSFEEWEGLRRNLGLHDLPNQWIGQVSWLKAGFFIDEKDGAERYIPAPVMRIAQIIGEGRVLTPGVAAEIMAAMNLPNRSIYGKRQIWRTRSEQEYRDIVEANRSSRGYRSSTVPLGHRQVLHRKPEGNDRFSGLVRRRQLKRWLAANLGAYIVQESR